MKPSKLKLDLPQGRPALSRITFDKTNTVIIFVCFWQLGSPRLLEHKVCCIQNSLGNNYNKSSALGMKTWHGWERSAWLMILTLELSKLNPQLAKHKMPAPKPSKYLKDSAGVPLSHPDKELLLKTQERQQTPLCQEGSPRSFFGFLQKTSKSWVLEDTFQSTVWFNQFILELQWFHHIQELLQPWVSQISLADDGTWTNLHQPLHQLIPSCRSNLGILWGALSFQTHTHNTTTCKIFFVCLFVFPSVSGLCKPHFPEFYQQHKHRASLWNGWHAVRGAFSIYPSPRDKCSGCIGGRHCWLPARP